MEITEVKVFPVNEEKLKAYVTIVLDNCFVVRDLKIIAGNSGLFVAMPSKKRKDFAATNFRNARVRGEQNGVGT